MTDWKAKLEEAERQFKAGLIDQEELDALKAKANLKSEEARIGGQSDPPEDLIEARRPTPMYNGMVLGLLFGWFSLPQPMVSLGRALDFSPQANAYFGDLFSVLFGGLLGVFIGWLSKRPGAG